MKMVEGSEARHRRLVFHRGGGKGFMGGGAGTDRLEGGGKAKSYNFVGQCFIKNKKKKCVHEKLC